MSIAEAVYVALMLAIVGATVVVSMKAVETAWKTSQINKETRRLNSGWRRCSGCGGSMLRQTDMCAACEIEEEA